MKYTITFLENIMMPNQLYGVTDDGQHFYFRGRGGRWQLHFGATEDDAISGAGYEGAEERAGWFDPEEWEAFFWQVIELIDSGKAEVLDSERHAKDMTGLLRRLTTPMTEEDYERLTIKEPNK